MSQSEYTQLGRSDTYMDTFQNHTMFPLDFNMTNAKCQVQIQILKESLFIVVHEQSDHLPARLLLRLFTHLHHLVSATFCILLS